MKSNNLNFPDPIAYTKKHAIPKLGIVFIAWIILQSYLVPLIAMVSGTDYNKYTNYVYLHTTISYTVIVLSIIIFSDSGLEVFQDYFSLGIIILTCFFRASLGGSNEIISRGILMFLGLALLRYVMKNLKYIKMPSLKSVFIGLLWSVGTIVALDLVGLLLNQPSSRTLPSNWSAYIINWTVYELSFVTIIEEAYFRGLLFGFLVMYGYKENTALFIQSMLFWGIHYMKIADPVYFFIIVPLFTLAIALITRKYRMLYLSIMVHTFTNVFKGVLAAIF